DKRNTLSKASANDEGFARNFDPANEGGKLGLDQASHRDSTIARAYSKILCQPQGVQPTEQRRARGCDVGAPGEGVGYNGLDDGNEILGPMLQLAHEDRQLPGVVFQF